jgi:hypothetical protein
MLAALISHMQERRTTCAGALLTGSWHPARTRCYISNRKEGELKARLQKVIDRCLAEKIRLGAMGGMPPKQ